MANELDIFRSASVLVKEFGSEEAKARARKHEAALLEKGEIIGASAWRAIHSAIEELGDAEPDSKQVH